MRHEVERAENCKAARRLNGVKRVEMLSRWSTTKYYRANDYTCRRLFDVKLVLYNHPIPHILRYNSSALRLTNPALRLFSSAFAIRAIGWPPQNLKST